MERPARAKLNTQIYEEACEWFIECRAGDLDNGARTEFDRWLRKSPEHQSAYLEIAAIWNEGPTLDPTHRWDLDTLIAQAAEDSGNVIPLERTLRPVPETPADPRQAPSSRTSKQVGAAPAHTKRLLALAASILLIVAFATYLLTLRGVYATALGEQRSLALNDGSTVQLNSLSKIRIRYTEHERTVDLLQGQALFHVAKDTTRPFIVYSGQTRVRAVGTQFDVYRKADRTTVTVVEGRVAVLAVPEPADSANGANSVPATDALQERAGNRSRTSDINRPMSGVAQKGGDLQPTQAPGASATSRANSELGSALPGGEGTLFLAAGEQITVNSQAGRRILHVNVAGATAWTQRELVFDSATLTCVAEEFNRYNERKLVIDPSALGTQHISGIFSSTDPTSLIHFIRDRPGLRVTETSTEIRVENDP